MSVTLTSRISITSNGSTTERIMTATAGTKIELDEAIAASQTNKQVNISFTFAAIQTIYLESDTDCTIKTNSSSSPDQTLTMKAGIPLHWVKNMPSANPITADVTRIFVTNGSVETNLTGFILFDPTP